MSGKIAFIGTHGVGKTVLTFSLTSLLRSRSIDADVVSENSRHSPFPINEATTLEGQMWILATQWQAELEAARRCSLVVCDRAVLDNYAYLVRACGEQEYLHPFLEQWMKTYSALFWVPIIENKIVKDRARATSSRFQQQIHTIIGDLVKRFGIEKRVVLLPEDRAAHTELILHTLNDLGLVPPEQRSLF